MKKILLAIAIMIVGVMPIKAQSCWWVFFADKEGTTFDPYSYFDEKAIERYELNNEDLYDISNYPVNEEYVNGVNALAIEDVGTTRWMNAVAVMAYPNQIEMIERLPYVKRVQEIRSEAQLAQYEPSGVDIEVTTDKAKMSDQLIRQQGQIFKEAGINGKGVRVAVFDGGFPSVNTHEAFKHLRDEGRILKTWNFPNKKEDVYGWSTHGTMVLSCIAGITGEGQQLGLATGAEFLLARTEVNPEPFKEEVWWMQAVEWADKNGAQVINSSLGYGKDRYYTKDMDGQSYVAKAANMAARKGIVVCNSAGNEGDDKRWKTIITPGDADSILTVGGTTNSLTQYRHIDFSSYGPTADGRMKPNVSNFGYARVADPSKDDKYTWFYGTSFSSPLTAGFVACAIQAHPGRTSMQMKREVEESADLYPYFDYALGYGVPQASYFIGGKKKAEKSFYIENDSAAVFVHFTKPAFLATVFMNTQLKNDKLDNYVSVEIPKLAGDKVVAIHKSALVDKKLNISYEGYTESIELTEAETKRLKALNDVEAFSYSILDTNGSSTWNFKEQMNRTQQSNYVQEKAMRMGWFVQVGDMIKTGKDEHEINWWSPAVHIGLRMEKPLSKKYKLGVGIDWGEENYRFKNEVTNSLDSMLQVPVVNGDVEHKLLRKGEINLEIFQRVRLVAGGAMYNRGLFWDFGIYGSWRYWNYIVKYDCEDAMVSGGKMHYRNPEFRDNNRWQWGLRTGLSYDFVGLYVKYSLSDIFVDRNAKGNVMKGEFDMNLPKLEFGIEFNL